MKTQSVIISNQQFVLHPSGALYWEEENILLIADVHFGKVMHFRKHGSAVPLIALYENFKRLDQVISLFQPDSLYFLGDLFHSHLNNEWRLFEDWVQEQKTTLVLITGNHDIISPHRYTAIGIQVVDEIYHNGFFLTHHPTIYPSRYNIAGHIHPGVMMKGKGRQRLTLPCFHVSKQQLILPAFGAFTGKHIIKPLQKDRIYATAGDEIIPIILK